MRDELAAFQSIKIASIRQNARQDIKIGQGASEGI
jgi:hypothetical protein